MDLIIGEDGTVKEYKEPYATIECATEEDFKKIENLIELGKAIEKVFDKCLCIKSIDGREFDDRMTIMNCKDLIEWAKEEEI